MKSNTIVLQNPSASQVSKPNLTIIFIVLALAGGGYFLYSKNKDSQDAKNQAALLQSDIFTRHASEFKKLIGAWYQFANNVAIIALAKQVTDFGKVVKAYSTLYSGENLEDTLRTTLNDTDYKNFIYALNFKGQQQTNTGTGAQVIVKPTGLEAGKSLIKLNTSTGVILGYKDRLNYDTGKPSISHAKNAAMQPFTFMQAVDHTYTNTGKTFTARLYLCKLPNGSLYWYRAADFVKQASAPALKALGSYNFGVKVA